MNHFVFLSTTSQTTSFKGKGKPARLSLPKHMHNLCKLLFLLSKTFKKKKPTLLLLINMKATLLQRDKLKTE